MIEVFVFFVFLYVAFIILYPAKWRKTQKTNFCYEVPDFYVYSFAFHIHTQFSYDSLGKPEDVLRGLEESNTDFALITDHENDLINKVLESPKVIGGVERKITKDGKVLGDLIEVDGLKVVAHPLKEKYRWRLEKDRDLFVELIDLKDALLKDKVKLLLFLIPVVILYPFLKERTLFLLSKLIDLDSYADHYLQEGWKNPIIGGHDHHVKIYAREVGIRFLFPHYKHSFCLMRNFLLSKKKVESAKELVKGIKENINVISFSDRPSFVWKEGRDICIQTPYNNTLICIKGEKEMCFEGSSLRLELEEGFYIIYAYRYLFKVYNLYLGLRPLFITTLEVKRGGDAPS